MSVSSEFQYTILRLVPSLERGERINVGVVLFCKQLKFLSALIEVDAQRLSMLTPRMDPQEVVAHLRAFCEIADGVSGAGAIAALSPSERFGWLAATSSTVIQPSPVHTGLTHDPAATLQRLFTTLVSV